MDQHEIRFRAKGNLDKSVRIGLEIHYSEDIHHFGIRNVARAGLQLRPLVSVARQVFTPYQLRSNELPYSSLPQEIAFPLL